MSSTNSQEILYSIVEYLKTLVIAEPENSAITGIISQLQTSYSLDTNDAEVFKTLSYSPVGLQDIFSAGVKALNLKHYEEALGDAQQNPKFGAFVTAVEKKGYFDGTEVESVEYYQRYSKLINKFKDKAAVSTTSAPSEAAATATIPAAEEAGSDAAGNPELERQAEELKGQGNAAISAKNYLEAAVLYSKALKLSSDGPNSHVYYSNRAAAYCHLNKYQEAINDCQASLQLVPDYVKAYSRLGLAHFFMEQFEEAVEAYRRAVELEPDNKASADSLRQAQSKLAKVQRQQVSSGGAAAGMPDLSALVGNPMMKQAMDKMGGSAGIANLMKDPQMMAMAQQMMKDPAMMQQAMSMLGGAGGAGGGGLPDMSALSGLMGGAGAPSSSSSSSSGGGGKKAFKGFEE